MGGCVTMPGEDASVIDLRNLLADALCERDGRAEEAGRWQARAEAAEAEVERWRTTLSAEMPKDFKDWWQNNPEEWPEVAASCLRARKADADMAWETVERLTLENADLKRVYAEVVAHYQHQFPDRPFDAGPDDQRIAMLLAKLTYDVQRLTHERDEAQEELKIMTRYVEGWMQREAEARRLLDQAGAALKDLLDVQNGPPLLAWEEAWQTAMDASVRVEQQIRAYLAREER